LCTAGPGTLSDTEREVDSEVQLGGIPLTVKLVGAETVTVLPRVVSIVGVKTRIVSVVV